MNVLHIISNASGGAAKAALRLHRSLLKNGIDSHFLTLGEEGPLDIPNHHIFGKTFDSIPSEIFPEKSDLIFPLNKLFPSEKEKIKRDEDYTYFLHDKKRFELFTWHRTQILELTQTEVFKKADVINLHWVSYFLDWPTFFSQCNKPIVWTMHDMNPFTGGCHYALDCEGFKNSCQNCPQLKPNFDKTNRWKAWAANNQSAKKKAIENKTIHVVADSYWLEKECRQSEVFSSNTSFQTIHYGIETEIFIPRKKKIAKEKLGISPNALTIGFGAEKVDNKRKGFNELAEALKMLHPQFPALECLVFGQGNLAEMEGLPKIHSFGKIDENERLAEIYAAGDIFVVPSLYEAFGQTAIEAMSCGTPVVAFDTGGLVDSVISGQTGWLAERGNAQDLAKKITEGLEDQAKREVFGNNAREFVVKNFDFDHQAEKYLLLYKTLRD